MTYAEIIPYIPRIMNTICIDMWFVVVGNEPTVKSLI